MWEMQSKIIKMHRSTRIFEYVALNLDFRPMIIKDGTSESLFFSNCSCNKSKELIQDFFFFFFFFFDTSLQVDGFVKITFDSFVSLLRVLINRHDNIKSV